VSPVRGYDFSVIHQLMWWQWPLLWLAVNLSLVLAIFRKPPR
jgi:hypothetical protein